MNGVPVLVETVTSLLIAVISLVAATATQASASPASTRAGAAKFQSAPYVRAHGNRFELWTPAGAKPIFFRGVNLGAGAPGHFPGEFAFTKADYRRYLKFARDLHANAIRVYALHPPAFYQALREENQANPRNPIWLFQEVWTELPESGDFWDADFTREFDGEIKLAVDALHGRANIAPRPGHAAGIYDADVSPWLAGWLLGREWEPNAVRDTERSRPDSTSFHGRYFEVERGTPMETWLARSCETAAAYEGTRYGVAHAVSFVTWPTLDVMRHPTESERGGHEADHDEDAYSVDPRRIRPLREATPDAGFLGYFANAHVYPYYPDFLNLDPGYNAFHDRHGVCAYAGYLRDLKAHMRGLPLLIGEYGVPTSRGVVHLQPQGINHGGESEPEQGRDDVRMLEDIADAECAGSLLFALFDEWFKVNWMVRWAEAPRERDPLWHNLLDPEESYGLVAFDPPPRIRIDGATDDWNGVVPYASDPKGRWIRALYVTSDQTRIYLRFDLAPATAPEPATIGAAIDVLDPARGDTRLPPPLQATWSRGAEFALVITPKSEKAEIFIDAAWNWSPWSRIRRGADFDVNRAPYRTSANHDGRFLPLLVETNRERVSRTGELYPARHLDWGRLSRGRDAAPSGRGTLPYDPHAEWFFDRGRRVIEVAIPWGLVLVSDPSSRAVVDDAPGTRETESSATSGIGFLTWATTAEGFRADSLGPAASGARPARPEQCQLLGPAGTTQSLTGQRITVTAPAGQSYLWNGWEIPITRERIKQSADLVRSAFEGMESREYPDRAQSGEPR